MLHRCQHVRMQGGNQDFFVGREEAMTLWVSAVHSGAGQREVVGPISTVGAGCTGWLHLLPGAGAGVSRHRDPPTACGGKDGKLGTRTQTFQGSSDGGERKGSALLCSFPGSFTKSRTVSGMELQLPGCSSTEWKHFYLLSFSR